MLGLVALGLTTIMIFTLVKNALKGKQLSADDTFGGTIDLLIPVTAQSRLHAAAWKESLLQFRALSGRLKIHVLMDGHQATSTEWNDLKSQFPFIEIHPFLLGDRNHNTNISSWMINQITPKITADIVIIGDSEIAASEAAFISVGKIVSEKKSPYLILPQTAKLSLLGETTAALNPTLALASVFGKSKWRRNLSYPLMALAQSWIAMPLGLFQELKIPETSEQSWKESMAKRWDSLNQAYHLAFGEKHLKRFYPSDIKLQFDELKKDWAFFWKFSSRAGFWIYVITVCLWAFPLLCFYTNPFASFLSIFLLILYRFFTKIVFQESWGALVLHFVGCIFVVGSLLFWIFEGLKSRFGTQGPKRIS